MRLQSFLVSGQKADFGLLLLDPDPLVINRLHHRLMAGPLGAALEPAWSFVSMTEVSEYVPTVEHFGQRLVGQGIDPSSEDYRNKLDAYVRRLEIMRRQRLTPDLPVWPAMCFYPMNKNARWAKTGSCWTSRHGAADERAWRVGHEVRRPGDAVDHFGYGARRLGVGRHALGSQSRVSPRHRYRMRFDEASAGYAEFGPFFVGYLSTAGQILEPCGVG